MTASTLTYVQVSVKTQSAATTDRILDLAEELVQTRGFHGFSYADIAGELGITRAALHYHFRSKADLGAALIERYHHQLRTRLHEIGATTPSPTRQLSQYADIYRAVFAEGRMCLCGMLAAEFTTLDEPLRAALHGYFETNYGWLVTVLKTGRKTGELHFTGDERAAAELVVSTLEGVMLLTRPSADVKRFDDLVARLIDQFTPPLDPA